MYITILFFWQTGKSCCKDKVSVWKNSELLIWYTAQLTMGCGMPPIYGRRILVREKTGSEAKRDDQAYLSRLQNHSSAIATSRDKILVRHDEDGNFRLNLSSVRRNTSHVLRSSLSVIFKAHYSVLQTSNVSLLFFPHYPYSVQYFAHHLIPFNVFFLSSKDPVVGPSSFHRQLHV